jgi:hypothetical protein
MQRKRRGAGGVAPRRSVPRLASLLPCTPAILVGVPATVVSLAASSTGSARISCVKVRKLIADNYGLGRRSSAGRSPVSP